MSPRSIILRTARCAAAGLSRGPAGQPPDGRTHTRTTYTGCWQSWVFKLSWQRAAAKLSRGPAILRPARATCNYMGTGPAGRPRCTEPAGRARPSVRPGGAAAAGLSRGPAGHAPDSTCYTESQGLTWTRVLLTNHNAPSLPAEAGLQPAPAVQQRRSRDAAQRRQHHCRRLGSAIAWVAQGRRQSRPCIRNSNFPGAWWSFLLLERRLEWRLRHDKFHSAGYPMKVPTCGNL